MAFYDQLGYEDDRFESTVGQNFHCPICMNIFKDPVICQRNQHCFCRPCITRHLTNSQSCPTCKEELTVETLSQAPRIFKNCWSELNIRCDYFNRGCREFVQLGDLEAHVKCCGFSPVSCSNEGCHVEINKRDQTHHETEVCEFRKVKCHDCVILRKEIEEMKMNFKDQMEEMAGNFNTVSDKLDQIKNQLTTVPAQIRSIQEVQEKMMREVESSNKDRIKDSKCNVIVAGGYTQTGSLNSTEKFNWPGKTWAHIKPMKEERQAASSVVHNSAMIVTGGWTGRYITDSIETININSAGRHQNWFHFPAKLPCKSYGHCCVVYDGRLIMIGGYDGNECYDSIHEVLLAPPYTSKLLSRMPQRRWLHGAQLFDDKIFICGGTTTKNCCDSIDSVIMYDISENECKEMSPLPYAVCEIATVSWGDNVIVMGGFDNDDKVLNTVVIYNVKTEESHMLPAMKYKRDGCVAVVVGNNIVVMGGKDERKNYLNSVESFSFDHYSWQERPSMNEPRHLPTAVSW